MNWEKYIKKQELLEVSEKIKSIEKESSVEIVVVIANKSSTTKHIKFTLFLLLTALFFVGLYGFNLVDHITDGYHLIIPLTHLLNVFMAFLLSKFFVIQRLFIPKQDQITQSENLAELEFYKQRINMTRSKTGLLIYISLLEKQAIVLCDQSISEKFPKNTWREMVKLITDQSKKNNLYQGLCEGLQTCSSRLKEFFPIEPQDINELPNHVILKVQD